MYRALDKEFKTKNEIKEYLIDLIMNNNGFPLKEKDFEIVKEVVKYVPFVKEKDGEVTEIVGEHASANGKFDLHRFHINIHGLKKRTKYTYEDKKCLVNVGTIVRYVPPVNVPTIDYIFTFGKYKGMNIKDISDNNYLYWLTSEDCSINKKVKGYIRKYLIYGFIPLDVFDH
jgi:hypothetical protein